MQHSFLWVHGFDKPLKETIDDFLERGAFIDCVVPIKMDFENEYNKPQNVIEAVIIFHS